MELSSSIAVSERMNGNESRMKQYSKFERMQLISIPDVERNSAKNKLTLNRCYFPQRG